MQGKSKNGVWGVGLAGNLSVGLRFDGQLVYVEDCIGNKGILVIVGSGGGTPNYGIGITGFYTKSINTIFDLEGAGVSVGGSVIWVGADINLSGGDAVVSESIAKGWAPADLHGTAVYSKLLYNWK